MHAFVMPIHKQSFASETTLICPEVLFRNAHWPTMPMCLPQKNANHGDNSYERVYARCAQGLSCSRMNMQPSLIRGGLSDERKRQLKVLDHEQNSQEGTQASQWGSRVESASSAMACGRRRTLTRSRGVCVGVGLGRQAVEDSFDDRI